MTSFPERGPWGSARKDRLDSIWDLQEDLNFTQGIKPRPLVALSDAMRVEHELDPAPGRGCVLCQDMSKRHGKWINELVDACSSELEELRNCTAWKYWCQEAKEGHRYHILDPENAKLEVVDLFHFVVSLAQVCGMTADDFFSLYLKKNQVNVARQESGKYAMATKTEDDNKEIGSAECGPEAAERGR